MIRLLEVLTVLTMVDGPRLHFPAAGRLAILRSVDMLTRALGRIGENVYKRKTSLLASTHLHISLSLGKQGIIVLVDSVDTRLHFYGETA